MLANVIIRSDRANADALEDHPPIEICGLARQWPLVTTPYRLVPAMRWTLEVQPLEASQHLSPLAVQAYLGSGQIFFFFNIHMDRTDRTHC